ncbi:hypothetical protein BCR39DRAFT_546161 [Naematelia encephala]|uniref:Uncharacterized protein n=1 Tax=Naematelia encephala TaxID=71784 RepID=A0A1Y2AQ42_9TREE|nr:hypothetical protein BCR39DRAFT_546161 [Naematelia encephala]
MDIVKLGEPSSPRLPSPPPSHLILPVFDIPSLKPLHPSQDLLTLLDLSPLYASHVKPYLDEEDPVPPSTAPGQTQASTGGRRNRRRRKLEKGYTGLIEDCIDPTPVGEGKDTNHLLPLLGDSPWVEVYDGPIERLDWESTLRVARLPEGHKESGYESGRKIGVEEAEIRRQKRKQKHLQSLAIPPPTPHPNTPMTDEVLIPVPPPSRAPFSATNRRSSGGASGGGGGIKPFGRGGARMTAPPGVGLGSKRPAEGGLGGGVGKKMKFGAAGAGESRSTSPAAGAAGGGGRSITQAL